MKHGFTGLRIFQPYQFKAVLITLIFFFKIEEKYIVDVKIYTCAPLPVCQIFDSENLYQFLSFFYQIVLVLRDILSFDIIQSIQQKNQKSPVLASDRHAGEGYDVRAVERPFSQTILEKVLKYLYFENSKSL